MIDRLESAFERIETRLASREVEIVRLRRVETAAAAALADLDELIGDQHLEAARPLVSIAVPKDKQWAR